MVFATATHKDLRRTEEVSMTEPSPRDITQMLIDWSNGDREALDRLIPVVYGELRRQAARHMRRERPGHTLQTTDLIHEAYLRLVDQKNVRWQNRTHFFAVAAHLMRRIVGKCLEKDRERRYSSARELLADLKNPKRDLEVGASATVAKSQERRRRLLTSRRWLAISALVMLVVAALSYLLLFRGAPTANFPEIKSVAVLPLANLSGDPAQEYFADGMTEALISNLARIRALRVISRTSVMRFKGSQQVAAGNRA